MNIVDLSIKRPVMVSMALVALVIFGLLSYFLIPKSLLPNVAAKTITVQTVYPGASPEVIENQVTKKIEDQVSSAPGLDYIQSYSMDSVSVVIVNFKYYTNENIDLQEVKDKVELIIADLPKDAEKPSITKVDVGAYYPVMNILVEGDLAPAELYTFADTTVKDRFSQVEGVGEVALSGGQEREIRVELDRATVFSRSVPIEQIAGILAAANVEIPGGTTAIGNQDIPVRFKSEFTSLDAIRNLDVPTPNGVFKLRQLADVVDSGKKIRERAIFLDKTADKRNENALLIKIVKNQSANTIDVVESLTKRIKQLETEYAGTVRFRVVSEDATFVRDTVNDTLGNVALGILFTGLILLFFLHDLRSTFIIALAMPFSVIATFLVMRLMGITANLFSLMGLSASLGTLVANSVVVLENIFRYKELGYSREEAASRGTREVIVAVFASTLTNMAVFVPLANVTGDVGVMTANFAYTDVIATVFSILVSFTLTPLMASRILPVHAKQEGRVSRGLEAMFKSWERGYAAILRFILKRRLRSAFVVIAAVAAFALSIVSFGSVPFEFFPPGDGGKIKIDVELPQGSSLTTTATVLSEIEKRAAEYKEVTSLLTNLGVGGGAFKSSDVSVAQMSVTLVPKAKRLESNAEIAARMTRTFSSIPGALIRTTPVSDFISLTPIDFYVSGPELDVLQDLSAKILAETVKVPGILNAATSSKAGKAELVFTPDLKLLSEDGLTAQSVAIALRAAVEGLITTTYKEAGKEYDIRVVLKDSALTDIEDIRNIPIVSASGTQPLSHYAEVRFAEGYNLILRDRKVRIVELTADLLPGYSQGPVLDQVMKAAAAVQLPPGYSIKQSGSSEELGTALRDLAIVFFIAVALTYMLLAATLEDLKQPLFILVTVPLSLIGVVAFALAFKTTLNFMAVLAIIMLVGIVVNNAILILDYYNQLRREGKDVRAALLLACPTKFKPVLMSNIAIVLGLAPMAMGIGASGAELRQPMGIVIVGGIVSSTILTLFVIPALEYLSVRRVRKPVAVEAGTKEAI